MLRRFVRDNCFTYIYKVCFIGFRVTFQLFKKTSDLIVSPPPPSPPSPLVPPRPHCSLRTPKLPKVGDRRWAGMDQSPTRGGSGLDQSLIRGGLGWTNQQSEGVKVGPITNQRMGRDGQSPIKGLPEMDQSLITGLSGLYQSPTRGW